MKFKTIFVFFNILIVVTFVFILFMPFFMLGGGYVKVFWKENWYFGAAFAVVLGALNLYYVKNRALFSFFEKEDWQGARGYLEEIIYTRKKGSRKTIRMLIHTYVVLADTQALEKLSRYLEEAFPRRFAFFALELGIPSMVQGNPDAMRGYFERALMAPGARKRPWLLWHSAFAGLGSVSAETRALAASRLGELASGGRDSVLRLLSAYLLDSRAEKDTAGFVQRIRAELKALHTRAEWEKRAGRFSSSLSGLVLGRLLADAEKWLFGEEENNNG